MTDGCIVGIPWPSYNKTDKKMEEHVEYRSDGIPFILFLSEGNKDLVKRKDNPRTYDISYIEINKNRYKLLNTNLYIKNGGNAMYLYIFKDNEVIKTLEAWGTSKIYKIRYKGKMHTVWTIHYI